MGKFPGNKDFAFAIFDDTDWSTLENTEPVYRFLVEIGVSASKSVWPLPEVWNARVRGSTLHDKKYLQFIRSLQNEGIEIALHNVRNHDSPRVLVERGFREFEDLLGSSPRIHCNHSTNRDNIYWGPNRLSNPAVRLSYNIATRFSRRQHFEGHIESSPYFWGDICKERITYVRNFVFDEINLDRVNPLMPYHDASRPYVNFWFSSSEGDTVASFCKMLCEANQDRLEAEEGVCIMYTHFGKGFYSDGCLNPEFKRLMRRLSQKNGWFVPVSRLLDHLRTNGRGRDIAASELRRMEFRWLGEKLRRGTS
jgi:hypothetical protein